MRAELDEETPYDLVVVTLLAHPIDARGLGHPIYPGFKIWLDRSPAWVVAGFLWGMSRIRSFRELLATGQAECRALVDVMVAVAPQARGAIDVRKLEAMKPA